MPSHLTCDVLIIGAGPAGSTTARIIAQSGINVIFLDKRSEIGVPVQCAEYVPWQIIKSLNVDDCVIAQYVKHMRTHIPNGEIVVTDAQGYTVNRDLFDQFLAKLATSVGAILLKRTRAISKEKNMVVAKQGKQNLKIEAKIIVGADGPNSTVGKWIECFNLDFIHAVQHRMPLINELNSTEIYFRKYFPGGYGWVFPKGKIANVGVGVNPHFGVPPKDALKRFISELVKEGIIKRDVLGVTAGLIPVNGLLKLCHKNIVLVGDAAGQTHPITGAGVPNAIFCGEIAGEVISRAINDNDLEILKEYEELCVEHIGDSIKHAVLKRKFLDNYWTDNEAELVHALKKSWIAFEEYYY